MARKQQAKQQEQEPFRLPDPESDHELHFRLTLSLPPKELSPNHGNRQGLWSKVSAKKTQREQAANLAFGGVMELLRRRPRWERAVVQATYYFATVRNRDSDNLNAMLKAAIDGCTDAGLLDDDAGLQWLDPVKKHDKQRPRVELNFWQGEIDRVTIRTQAGYHEVQYGRTEDHQ